MAYERFHITYETITEESAAEGDAADRGFIVGGNMHVTADTPEDYAACAMSLREAINKIGCLEDSGSWFSETDGSEDYQTGDREYKALHPPHNITGASYARVARVLKAKRLL